MYIFLRYTHYKKIYLDRIEGKKLADRIEGKEGKGKTQNFLQNYKVKVFNLKTLKNLKLIL